jgi:branched-chain amino acid transport system substrate-binding protein
MAPMGPKTSAAAVSMALAIAACRPSRPLIDRADSDERATVGAALPLSGRLKAFGETGRDTVRFAAGELEKTPEHPLKIIVRDSQGDASGAAKAIEDLVTQDRAIAIVGPMFRVEATPAGEKAQDLAVPLIALTGDREVTNAGAYVFRAGLSVEEEIDALVAHAIDVLRLKRIAILHPRIEYGQRMVDLFRARVEERGAAIYAVESYGEEDTTFTEQMRRLVQRDAPGKRRDYHEALAKCKEARDSYRKARCEREARENLPPIVEFDALFIPDTHERIALIAPAVAAEDVIVERDPRRLQQIEKTLGRKIEPITLLGTSAWNSSELPKKAGRAVENAIFPDAFFEGATDRATKTFVAAFRKQFGRSPLRHDALLYDATRFLRELLADERLETTNDLRAAMHDLARFEGVTGDLSFHDGNEVERKLKLLTIKDQTIREVH